MTERDKIKIALVKQITERDKISLVKQTLTEDLNTLGIVKIFNEWCDENHYSERCYSMDCINEQLSGYKPSKILTMAQGTDFNIFDTYFYINDLDEIFSFNLYDDEKSPIDIDELAKEIVYNNCAYGNACIKDLLDKFEAVEETEENDETRPVYANEWDCDL